jgi:lipoprotein signal peptidase
VWNNTYPTFNVADSAIVLCAGIMIIDYFKPLDKVEKKVEDE